MESKEKKEARADCYCAGQRLANLWQMVQRCHAVVKCICRPFESGALMLQALKRLACVTIVMTTC